MGEHSGLIQYKYRLKDKDKFLFKSVEESIEFSDPKASSYTYFKLPIDSESFTVLRSKITDNKKSIDLKVRDDKTGEWEHYESGVDDLNEIKKILEAIGCKPMVIFNKQRYTYKQDGFRLDLDDNDKLGPLLEVKFKPEKKDFVLGLLRKFGLKEGDRDMRSILEIYLEENK